MAPDSRYSFENVESNSPRNVSPELLEIIRKQELEISLLKEQLQMLIVNSNSNNVASSSDEGSRTRKSSGDRDNDSNTNSQKLIHGGNSPKEPRQHPTVAVDDIIEPVSTLVTIFSNNNDVLGPSGGSGCDIFLQSALIEFLALQH